MRATTNDLPLNDLSLLRLLLDAKRDEYQELCDRWRDLDSKAQGLITLTGVLLTGFLAFASAWPSSTRLTQRIWFSSIVVFFAVSIASAAYGLWIRAVMESPSSNLVQEIVEDLMAKDESLRKSVQNEIILELVGRWTECNSEIRKVLKSKLVALKSSQIFAAIPIVLLIIPSVSLVLR